MKGYGESTAPPGELALLGVREGRRHMGLELPTTKPRPRRRWVEESSPGRVEAVLPLLQLGWLQKTSVVYGWWLK